ncbi:unnamed protein product [Parnassius apollo]|uniref:(apollo) hypothetical protein n=1 Tax=Parnassius apollo TaxID=110799 RepID=A0A8S3XIV3_PARAO|nr:unnamed protein product [Parnassius apollo]
MDGGGVLIAVSREIPSMRMSNWETDCEDLWVNIGYRINGSYSTLSICAVYLPSPPRLEQQRVFVDNLDSVLNHIDNVIVMGDFNLNFVDWEFNDDCNHTIPTNYNNDLGRCLVDCLSMNNLYQFNHIRNSHGRTLDLALSSLQCLNVSQPLDLLSKLDLHHPPNCNIRT